MPIYKKLRVLLIPAYYYSSNPLFLSIKELLPDWLFIYHFSKDVPGSNINAQYITFDRIGYKFDEYCELKYDPYWLKKRETVSRIFLINKLWLALRYFVGIRRYVAFFKRSIKKINPDIVILPSDMTFSARLIQKCFPNLPVVVIQPNFLDFREKTVRYAFFKRIVNRIVGAPFYSKQSYFGLEDTECNLLIWGDKSAQFYSNKRRHVYRISNPEHCSIVKQVEQLRQLDPYRNIKEISCLNASKKTIVIFVDSFVSLYGADFQVKIEQGYCAIIKKNISHYNVILKIHPAANLKYFQDVFNDLLQQNQLLLLQDLENFYAMLAIADINISTFSYAGFQAALAGSISINFFPCEAPRDSNFDWLAECSALDASSADQINNFIELLEDPDSGEMERCRKRTEAFIDNYVTSDSRSPEYWQSLFTSFLTSDNRHVNEPKVS